MVFWSPGLIFYHLIYDPVPVCSVLLDGVSQEFLLKRTTGLSAIARAGPGKVLADPDARGYALAVLDELNFSTPIAFKQKEKGAAAAAMSLLAPSALQVQLMRSISPEFCRLPFFVFAGSLKAHVLLESQASDCDDHISDSLAVPERCRG